MSDYISREAAIKAINDMYEYEFPKASGPLDEFYVKFVPSTLRAIPAADVIEVVRCGACEREERSLMEKIERLEKHFGTASTR